MSLSLGVLKLAAFRKLPYIRWKSRTFSKGLSFSNRDKKFFKLVLDEQELKTLLSDLKGSNKALNSYLLCQLTRFMADEFVQDEVERLTWMLTVNMRGAKSSKNLEGVQSSFFDFVVDRAEDSKSIDNRLRKKLEDGDHWVAWKAASILPALSKKMCFNAVKSHIMFGGPPYIGIFSNLGSWKIKNCRSPYFLVRANVSRTRPVSVAFITVNGRLTITFSFHETIKVTTDFVNKLDILKNKIMEESR